MEARAENLPLLHPSLERPTVPCPSISAAHFLQILIQYGKDSVHTLCSLFYLSRDPDTPAFILQILQCNIKAAAKGF